MKDSVKWLGILLFAAIFIWGNVSAHAEDNVFGIEIEQPALDLLTLAYQHMTEVLEADDLILNERLDLLTQVVEPATGCIEAGDDGLLHLSRSRQCGSAFGGRLGGCRRGSAERRGRRGRRAYLGSGCALAGAQLHHRCRVIAANLGAAGRLGFGNCIARRPRGAARRR